MIIGKELAEYITKLSYEELTQDAVHMAKRLLLDSISTILLGSNEEGAENIYRFINKLETKAECTIVGKKSKTCSIWAAFANASYSQLHDFNDGHRVSGNGGGSYHPGRVIIPTALAVGEKLLLSGKDIITAIVVGYDVATRIRGIKNKPPADAYCSAAVAGRLMGLSESKILNALGIAGCMASGKVGMDSESDVDHLANGYMAKVGIEAAMQAKEGLTGPPIYDDSYLSARFKEKGLWKEFEIMNVYIKPYPVCRMIHGAIDAVLSIKKEFSFQHSDIEEVRIHQLKSGMYVANKNITPNSSPKSCQFSMEYSVAYAIIDGQVGVEQFTKEKISDHIVHELIQRIKVIPDESLDVGYPEKTRSTLVIIKLKSGNEYKKQIDIPKGDSRNPLSDEELNEKFYKAASVIDTFCNANKIKDTVFALEKIKCISELMSFL